MLTRYSQTDQIISKTDFKLKKIRTLIWECCGRSVGSPRIILVMIVNHKVFSLFSFCTFNSVNSVCKFPFKSLFHNSFCFLTSNHVRESHVFLFKFLFWHDFDSFGKSFYLVFLVVKYFYHSPVIFIFRGSDHIS